MGTWDYGSFDNDTAADWVYDFSAPLTHQQAVEKVENTLMHCIDESEKYLDSDIACDAIAACEFIARMKGNWGKQSAYSEKMDNWIKKNPFIISNELVTLSQKALEYILKENSELNELWLETNDYERWKKEILDLKSRIVN